MSKPEFVYVTYIKTTPEQLWDDSHRTRPASRSVTPTGS